MFRPYSLTIEANSVYLAELKKLFFPSVIHLKYTGNSDVETDTIGNVKQQIHEADFVKTSNISITQRAGAYAMLPNAGIRPVYGGLGFYDRFGRGSYEVTVTLEEV